MNDKHEFLRVLLENLWNSGFVSQDAEIPIVGFDYIVPWRDDPYGFRSQEFCPSAREYRIEVCKFPANTADGRELHSLVGFLFEIITVAEGGGILETMRVNWKEKKEETIKVTLSPGTRVTLPESIPHRLVAGPTGMKAIRVYLRADLFF